MRFRFLGLKYLNFIIFGYFLSFNGVMYFIYFLVVLMRGRGIVRGMMGGGGRMDFFRIRIFNISRFLFMYVDDFMKLEKG